jgi:glycosidase
MKKLALISSFCDTEEKKNVLTENLDILKNLNIDTLLISPIQSD